MLMFILVILYVGFFECIFCGFVLFSRKMNVGGEEILVCFGFFVLVNGEKVI